jgi:hypothetical protein
MVTGLLFSRRKRHALSYFVMLGSRPDSQRCPCFGYVRRHGHGSTIAIDRTKRDDVRTSVHINSSWRPVRAKGATSTAPTQRHGHVSVLSGHGDDAARHDAGRRPAQGNGYAAKAVARRTAYPACPLEQNRGNGLDSGPPVRWLRFSGRVGRHAPARFTGHYEGNANDRVAAREENRRAA